MEKLKKQIKLLYSQMLDLNNRYSQEIISFFKATEWNNSIKAKKL